MDDSVFSSFSTPKGGLFSSEEPFVLLLDQRQFVCANINGFDSNSLYLVDALKEDVEGIDSILDLFVKERKFIDSITFLKESVFSQIPAKFSMISATLNNVIPPMLLLHNFFLDGFNKILKERPIKPKNLINLITHSCNVIPSHENYIFQYIGVESMVTTFCCEYPDLSMQNTTLISLFKSPFTWIQNTSSFARFFSSILINQGDLSSAADLEEFATSCDNIMASADSIPLLDKISHNFIIEPFPIVQNGRRVLKQGFGMKHCRKDVAPRALVLFSDFLVYAQPKGGKWLIPSAYPVSQMKVEQPISDIPCVSVYTPRKSFVLEFANSDENREWFVLLSRAITNARASDDSLGADIPFAPIWIPDKATHVCMKCQQEHTFFVRRHHCRACGCVACSNCLKFRAIVKGVSQSPVKVCQDCYNKINANAEHKN